MAMDMAAVDMKMESPVAEETSLSQSSEEIVDRKLIRNGSLDFKTDEVKKTKTEIEKI